MLRGFGITFDLEKGTSRRWVCGSDGVKRWVDNNEPCDKCEPDIKTINIPIWADPFDFEV